MRPGRDRPTTEVPDALERRQAKLSKLHQSYPVRSDHGANPEMVVPRPDLPGLATETQSLLALDTYAAPIDDQASAVQSQDEDLPNGVGQEAGASDQRLSEDLQQEEAETDSTETPGIQPPVPSATNPNGLGDTYLAEAQPGNEGEVVSDLPQAQQFNQDEKAALAEARKKKDKMSDAMSICVRGAHHRRCCPGCGVRIAVGG